MMDILDSAFGYRLLSRKRSVKAIAQRNHIPYRRVRKVNDEEFVRYVESLALDLIISYSAPTVFRPRLLRAARLGCINLHCSVLPEYAGILPSFWVLYDKAVEGGATVHYMNDKIDNGAILAQREIPVPPGVSMFKWIHMTKDLGGELMAETVARLVNGGIDPVPNDVSKGSYYSWPTIQQMREFRRRGGRLV
jgi:methionyl-tRNA formyltransferase